MAKRVKRSDAAKQPVTAAQARMRAAAALRRRDAKDSRERAVRQDRWVNPATGMGTWDDKTRHGFFDSPFRLMDTEITALANGNDLAAKLIEKRPDEMFRRGYELEPVKSGVASDNDFKMSDLKEILEYANKELKFDARTKQGIKYGRQYGGSLLVLAIDDGRQPWQPVDEDNIRSVQSINQIDRRFAYVQSYYSDYLRPKYGEAKTYLIANGVATSAERDDDEEFFMKKRSQGALRNAGYSTLNVHESRVIRFGGVETDVITRQQLAGWSWSVMQRPYEALRQTDSSFDSLCYLISDASQAVMKLKGLFRAIESGQKSKLEERMKMMERSRSVMRGIALDAGGEEDFTRVQTPLTGIPESIDRMMQRCAAAFDMPLTELFGMSPAGMNATGESDRIKWYDTIASDQTNFLAPAQLAILRLIMLAKRGPTKGRLVPIKFHYHPLYAPTEAEIADTRLKNAQRDEIYFNMSGPVTADAIALTVTDVYPSLKPEEIEADMDAKTVFDPHENDPIASKESQALTEGHPAVQGDPKAGGGVKVPVPKPAPVSAPVVKAVGGAAGTGTEGAGGAGEAQSPTVPLPGSSLHGGAAAAKNDRVDPGPNVAKDVYKQLLKDFPHSASSWALAGQWEGPKEVDLSRIDFSTRDQWRATRDPDKVDKYVEKLDDLAPVILVDVRGSNLLEPVDGHHRLLAYEKAGRPALAYVCPVQCKEGPWTDLHTMVQKGSSGDTGGTETSRQSARGEASRPASRTDGVAVLPLVVRHDETHEHYAGEFEDMHDGGKEVKQSSKDKKKVYADANDAQLHQDKFLAHMETDLGAHTVRLTKGSEREQLTKGLDQHGPTIIIAGMKSPERADEKATKENGGDWSKMGDLVRSTIAVDKTSDMKPMIDKLKARMKSDGITLARAPSDRFAKPLDGYRDVLLNVKYPNGHVGEIQLHVKSMLRAKELGGGHKLYEESRTIRGNANHEGREHTESEKATIAANSAKSEAIYGAAIEEARR